MNTFSIKECLSFGWKTFKARPWFFIIIPFIIILAGFASGVVQGLSVVILGKTVGSVVYFLVSVVVNTFVAIGIINVYLKAHDSVSSARFHDLWSPAPFWKLLGTNVLVGICVIIGFILLIIPGIILALMFMFATYLAVDRGMFPIAAMKESARLTKGKRVHLLLFVLSLIVLNLVGAILLIVGLLVTVPVSLLAGMHVYRLLSQTASSAAAVPAA